MTKRGRSDSTSSDEQELFRGNSASNDSVSDSELDVIALELDRMNFSGSRIKSSKFEETQKLSVEEAAKQEQDRISGAETNFDAMMDSRNQEFASISEMDITPAAHVANSGQKSQIVDQKDVDGNKVGESFTFSALGYGPTKGNSK